MKVKSQSEVVQSCLTLSDPMDCSLPGSSTHAIFQARVLEWVAIAFSDDVIYLTLKFVFALLRFLISPFIFHQWILVSELDKPKYSAINVDIRIVGKENLGSFGSFIN